MDLAEKTLKDEIDERAKSNNYFSDSEVRDFMKQMVLTLTHLQISIRIYHRDIKPSNILKING